MSAATRSPADHGYTADTVSRLASPCFRLQLRENVFDGLSGRVERPLICHSGTEASALCYGDPVPPLAPAFGRAEPGTVDQLARGLLDLEVPPGVYLEKAPLLSLSLSRNQGERVISSRRIARACASTSSLLMVSPFLALLYWD